MKKKILGLSCIAVMLLATGCNKNTKIYKDLKKIAPYLYEITYNDYREDKNLETISGKAEFGCSSVRNGNFYGRNFDYIFNDVPEFVVKVKATKNRHASIGIANHTGIRDELLQKGKYDKALELIPNATLDGINDSGVICSNNVVPIEDVEPVTGTNPNGKDLHMLFIPRFVLDNASSADEAIELLKQQNIYGNLNNKYYLHIMIADKNKTYVVEFINNQLVAQEKTGDNQIMTNYYVNLDKYTEHAAGIERYNILKKNYNEGSTFEGMWNLMQRVKFSNVYRYDNEQEFHSEMATQSLLNNQGSKEWEEYIATVREIRQNYWVAVADDVRYPADPHYWHTTHNSIYDIEKRKLRVTVQEDYKHTYDFSLNDVK